MRLLILTAILFVRPVTTGENWPALHGDNARSGCYDAFPAPPLQQVWHHDLSAELTGPRAEVIVAQGIAFMGSYAGNVRAWDAATGEERWKSLCGGPVMHSPAWAEGKLYVASMSGLYCLDAATGNQLGHGKGEAGFLTSPAVAGGLVMAGDRAGVFHAWDPAGHEKWTLRTAAPILTPASVEGEIVVFASEDMQVRCCRLTDGVIFCIMCIRSSFRQGLLRPAGD